MAYSGAMPAGLILAAPRSGSGKTIVTLALLGALRRRDLAVAAAKSGPDYIDGAFLAAASGAPCVNLDAWAMRSETIAGTLAAMSCEFALCEGAMGLFDGPGSTASLAALVGWPVVLVVDATGMGASVAALVAGFARYRSDTPVAGLILNRVGSPRHGALLAAALAAELPELPLLGALPRVAELILPSRHLGLVQAGEQKDLPALVDRAAELAERHVDVARLVALARPSPLVSAAAGDAPLPPLGQRIAVARDPAFAFAYPIVLEGWRTAGASIAFFSPLADEGPPPDVDAVFLPGGYPELHAGRIASAQHFRAGLATAAARGATIYGECGGYMVLGRGLIDAEGGRHAMAGLLPLETSFAQRALHLGYRRATLAQAVPLGDKGARYRGHEFHYATIVTESTNAPLFELSDCDGAALAPAGAVAGTVMGSFVHLVDRAL